METIKFTLSDETLRDGEQQVGICFSSDTKAALAHQIAQTGVRHIALMPSIHSTEESLIETLVAEGLSSRLTASTLMSTAHIQQAYAKGVQHITLFHAVSDRLLLLRNPDHAETFHKGDASTEACVPPNWLYTVRHTMVKKVLSHLQFAAQLGLKINFAAEDASRADFDFLVDCINTFAPYIDYFLLCDTVGILTPEKSYIWLHDLLESTNHAALMVHFHNDMGLALENTIQAVRAGAAGISGTFKGIGERAGNVALEQVLNGLRLRFGWEVEGIDYDAIARVTQTLESLGVQAHPPYSQAAQRHEAGIHVHSLLRDRLSYAIFPYGQPEIWFGKHSGASNVRYLFEHCLQHPLTRAQYDHIALAIKTLAIEQNRSFSVDEIVAWLRQQGFIT